MERIQKPQQCVLCENWVTTETALLGALEEAQAELARFHTSSKVALDHAEEAETEANEARAQVEERAQKEGKEHMQHRLGVYLAGLDADKTSTLLETSLLKEVDDTRQELMKKEQEAAFADVDIRHERIRLLANLKAAGVGYKEKLVSWISWIGPDNKAMQAGVVEAARVVEEWAAMEMHLNAQLLDAEQTLAAEEERALLAEENESEAPDHLRRALFYVADMGLELSTLQDQNYRIRNSWVRQSQRTLEIQREFHASQKLVTTLKNEESQLEKEFEDMQLQHERELKEVMARCDLLEHAFYQEEATRRDQEIIKRLLPHDPAAIDEGGSLEQLKQQLQHKGSELSSCSERLASLKSTNYLLAEAIIGVDKQCKLMRAEGEAFSLPDFRAMVDSLQQLQTSDLHPMEELFKQVEDLEEVLETYNEQMALL